MHNIHISCTDNEDNINFIFNFDIMLGLSVNEKENIITFYTEKGAKKSNVKNIKKELKELATVLGIRKIDSDLFLSFSQREEQFYILSERVESIEKAFDSSTRSLIKFNNTNEIMYVDKNLNELYDLL